MIYEAKPVDDSWMICVQAGEMEDVDATFGHTILNGLSCMSRRA